MSLNAEQQRAYQTHQSERRGHADSNPQRGEYETLPEHEPEDVCTASTQRQTHTDVVSLLDHGIGNHPVDSNRGQQQCESGEDAHQRCRKTAHEGRGRCRDQLRHRLYVKDSRLWLERLDLAANRSCQGRRFSSGANYQIGKNRGVLPEWEIDDRSQLLVETSYLYIAHHANDRHRRSIDAAVSQTAADRAAPIKQSIGHRLADDHHRGIVRFVMRVKLSSFDEWDLQRLKVTVADCANICR